MSILQAKYKAHRLVNSIFYIIIFFIGFLIGIGAKNIDFSKLASNILFIDNVSASESDNVFIKLGDLEITNNYIYSKLFDDTGYSYEDYPYVFLTYIYDVNRESYRELNLYAFSSVDDFVINYYNSFGTARYIINGRLSNVLYYEERYDYSTNEIIHNSLSFFNTSSLTFYTSGNDDTSRTSNKAFSNFDFTQSDGTLSASGLSSLSKKVNKLDFSSFIKLDFDENLFANDDRFKEVCVPNNKKFAISTNQYEIYDDDGSKHFTSYEFIWFPYKVEGLTTFLYDNSKEDNVWILDKDETYFEMNPGYWYWLNSVSEVDLYFGREDPGSFLLDLGYTDKYKYYGWYFHPFIVRYAASGLKQFSVFWFRDTTEVTYLDGTSNDNIENYCFYIRKEFDVNLLNSDEFGDLFGDFNIMDEDFHLSTSKNASDLDSKGLFEKVKIFLSKISGPINFVNDRFYDFYNSLPELIKLFILSVFGLIVVKILVGMVVR